MKKGLCDIKGLLVAMAIAGVGLIGCGGASASSPERVADQLTESDAALRAAIDEWRAGGDPPATPPPQEALDQTRALQADARFLTAHPNLTEHVLPLIPGSLASEFRRLTRAHRDLLRLS